MDEYKTIATAFVWETKIERSTFIVHLQPVEGEQEAKLFINGISEQHKQATHNCYAYRLGYGETERFFYSDDGEPNGTAGKPIYGAILREDITNVAVVVTRYFGGKKLGVRGLINAYGGTTLTGIEKAQVITKHITKTISLRCSYPELNQIMYTINKWGADIVNQDFGVNIHLSLTVRQRDVDGLLQQLGQLAEILT